MKKYIAPFHYLTQDVPVFTHPELATAACEAGAKWIQYRSKNNADKKSWLDEAAQMEAICDDWGPTLIICSGVEVCMALGAAQGGHLERGYIPCREASRLPQPHKTTGGT